MRVLSKRRTLVLAGVLAVAAVTTIVLATRNDPAPPPPDPERVLRDYLEAARTGKVDEALRIAGVERPTGPEAAFLTATSSDWQVAHLQRLGGDDTGTARFSVAIGNSESGDNTNVTMRRHGAGWRIDHPLVAITFPASPFWYIDVNGKKVRLDGYDQRAAGRRYLLLPGVYEFYQDASMIKARMGPLTALPGAPDLTPEFDSVGLTSMGEDVLFSLGGDGGFDAATRLVNAHVDQCVAMAQPRAPGCPFGATGGYGAIDVGDYYGLDDPQLTWTVLEYPEFWAHRWYPDGFQVAARPDKPGRVRVSGTGTEFSGERVSFTVECPMDLTEAGLLIGGTADGTLTLDYYERRYLGSEPPVITTCQ